MYFDGNKLQIEIDKHTRISNKTILFYLQKYITFFVANQVSSSYMASPIAKGSTSPGNFKNESLSIWYFYIVASLTS